MADMRMKITDKVTFPLILDMNLFCCKKSIGENLNSDTKNNNNLPILDANFFAKRAESKINFDALNIQNDIKNALEHGENVYELYSIVIHSGTANGGHYYAYIKSFEDNCWYSFNDSDVSRISESEIENVFGNKNPTGFSSATGYVLSYRKIFSNENKIHKIEDDIIDEELMKEINEDIEKALEEERAWRERMNLMTVKIYFENLIKEIKFRKNENIFKMKEKILKEFMLEDKYKIEDFMLRNYIKNFNKKTEYIEYEDLVNKN